MPHFVVAFVLSVAVALTLFPGSAMARCSSAVTSVWPSGSTPLPARPEIVLMGYGSDASEVQSVGSQHPTLVSDRGHRVSMSVVMIQRGEFRVSQAVLSADSDLHVGRTYRLRVNGRFRRDREGNVAEWMVAGAGSHPAWNSAPTALAPERVRLGCGPREHVPVMTSASFNGPARYRVRLWLAGTNESTARAFDVTPHATDPTLRVGHGMCSGPFDPPTGTPVFFRVSLVAADGTEVPAPGPPLSAVFP